MMTLTIFHQDARRLFRGEARAADPYGHRFGGEAAYSGLASVDNCVNLQVIYQTCPLCNAVRTGNQCT